MTDTRRESLRQFSLGALGVILLVGFARSCAWIFSTWNPANDRRSAVIPAVALGLLSAAALWALLPRHPRRFRALRATLVIITILVMTRYELSRDISTARQNYLLAAAPNAVPSHWLLTSFLRRAAAAQAQYRLRNHTFASSLDSLRPEVAVPLRAEVVEFTRGGDSGWAASVSLDGVNCSIWSGDSTLRHASDETDGAPQCDGPNDPRANRHIHGVPPSPKGDEVGFSGSDVWGSWEQHRGDATRSGIARPEDVRPGAYRWTTHVGGEVLASVAVAGNQVFVGAHGNGEVDVLTLDSGTVGYRVSAPNWIHHAPVVTADLAIFGFGNNELPRTGSPPAGVVAYDRRTGLERWRQYTRGSVMTSPIVHDSTIVAISSVGEVNAWRARDGEPLWQTKVNGSAWMGNPLISDSVVIVGLEPARVCALDVETGHVNFCTALRRATWGGGHASVALGPDVILMTFARDPTVQEAMDDHRWGYALAKGLHLPAYSAWSQVLVGVDARTGAERWRVELGVGDAAIDAGHIAGTPTVVDRIAYVPSPISGRIFAVQVDSGRVIWSTDVETSRGSVVVTQGAVLGTTRDTSFVVLDAATGAVRCRERLPGIADRAALTLAGQTGILTLRNGTVEARPIQDWLACKG